MDVEVEDDACLVVLPGPVIPFRGSRYFQRGRVELAPRARLIWGDIWLPGRYDRGELSERFQFERIVQDFEVRRAGRLVYRDRFRWDGPWNREDAGWYWGGALASASLFVAGPVPEALPEAGPALQRSVFRLDSGDSCMRWCGHPAAVTADLVYNALLLAASWTDRARCASVAPRLERPRPESLVLEPEWNERGLRRSARRRRCVDPNEPVSELDQETDPT